MMEWRLSNLQGEYKQKFKENLSYRRIATDTGLSKTTVADIALGKIRRPDEDTMNVLLTYMSRMLQRPLITDDLWRFTPDEESSTLTPLTAKMHVRPNALYAMPDPASITPEQTQVEAARRAALLAQAAGVSHRRKRDEE